MSNNQQAARRPRFPSQFDCYYADESAASETPAEVEGYYASYSVELAHANGREFERPFTPIEEAFFSAGDELSEQHAEQLPTTRFAPAAPAPAKKKPVAASASGRRRVATA